MSDDVQAQMRHDHAVCMLMAAYVYAEHEKGRVMLDSEAFRNRMQTIKDESDVDFKFVTSAFAQIVRTMGSIQCRAACAALGEPAPSIALTQLTGSIVKTETAVFKEVCIEFMLEHDRDKFIVYDRGFELMLERIAADLGSEFDIRKIANTMIEVYVSAEHRHLREVAEKALANLKKVPDSADAETPHLRLASG